MQTIFKSEYFIHGLMLITIILAASSFAIVALITNELSAKVLLFLRFLLAAILFTPLVFIKYGIKLPSLQSLFNFQILSIPLVIFFWCMFESLRYTSILNTGALYTIVPVFTAIAAFFINRENISKTRAIGLVLGTLGALWIVFRGDFNSLIIMDFNYGDTIFLMGCFFLSLYNPLVKRLHQGEAMEVLTLWTLLIASFWLFIFSSGELSSVAWSKINVQVYWGILYLSFFTTLITFFLINYCTVRIGATRVAAYGFLTPVIVIIFSIITGEQKIEFDIVFGLLLILFAMFIIQFKFKSIKL